MKLTCFSKRKPFCPAYRQAGDRQAQKYIIHKHVGSYDKSGQAIIL
jgi:hypothetical protein